MLQTIHLFSYGTLQLEQVQKQIFGQILPNEPDILVGFKMVFIEIVDKNVLQTSGQKQHPKLIYTSNKSDYIKGKVFKINKKQLKATDQYEVSDYKRIEVILESRTKAWVYVDKDMTL